MKEKWRPLLDQINNMMQTAKRVWPKIVPVLFVPQTQNEYRSLVTLLDILIEIVGEDENHPLVSFMEVIGVLIEKYEDENVPDVTEI